MDGIRIILASFFGRQMVFLLMKNEHDE